jgi:hypothetical protein
MRKQQNNEKRVAIHSLFIILLLTHFCSNSLNLILNNIRPVFGYGDVVFFGYPTSGVTHLVA